VVYRRKSAGIPGAVMPREIVKFVLLPDIRNVGEITKFYWLLKKKNIGKTLLAVVLGMIPKAYLGRYVRVCRYSSRFSTTALYWYGVRSSYNSFIYQNPFWLRIFESLSNTIFLQHIGTYIHMYYTAQESE